MMLLNLGIVPTENHSKITPICRSHADYYVVIVVKNFNPESADLNGINKTWLCIPFLKYMLGLCYRNGFGVEKDDRKACPRCRSLSMIFAQNITNDAAGLLMDK